MEPHVLCSELLYLEPELKIVIGHENVQNQNEIDFAIVWNNYPEGFFLNLPNLKAISSYADICEIGIGHNCNTGDGKQIQDSTYRAIKNGIKIRDIFRIVKKFKKTENAKPCILMGYYNSVVQYGENRFIKKCKQNGVDGSSESISAFWNQSDVS